MGNHHCVCYPTYVLRPMNLQNIPADEMMIRRCFVPKNDYFLCCDYSNIELRLLAYYLAMSLDDWQMVYEFKTGLDLHSETARMMWPNQEITPRLRKTAKILNFSIVYGGGTPTLIKQGLVSNYQEARQLLRRFDDARPGVKILAGQVTRTLHDRGWIETPWGRRLHPETDHKALNALIQGSAADLMKDAIVNVARAMREMEMKSNLVFTIHDEIGIDGVDNELYHLGEFIPKWMDSKKYNDVVPIEVEINIARGSWANKELYVPA